MYFMQPGIFMKTKPYTMLLMMLAGWVNRRQQEAINYLMEENKILKHELLKATGKERRLEYESMLISTISLCKECYPSSDWFGLHSPKKKIRESGLWLVNELYNKPFSDEEFDEFKGIAI